jgi:predicted ribosome-associated RNA-binding protein Tma20/translation initiation factor 1 (eIF-1/SUI1)
MFKNEITTTQSNILSKKDKKDLCKKWTLLYDNKCLNYILKEFNELTIYKTNLKRKIISYEGNPIFFEYDNDLYYPSVYLLNYFPNFVKRKCIIYDETDSFLDNGADLMLKGILNRYEFKKLSFKLNDVFAVQTITGIVTSVGISLCSSNTLNVDNPAGKFLKIIHRINDSLWNFGTKKIPKNLIEPELPEELKKMEEEVVEAIENIIEEKLIIEPSEIHNEENIGKIEQIEEEAKEDSENINKDKLDEEDIEHIEDNKVEVEEEHKYTEEEIDNNINTVFFTALKLVIKPDMLPLDPGKLLKEYLKPLASELNLYIDFKKSSYKKVNNYLKHLQKQDLLTFVKPKNLQNEFITHISWENPLIKDFIPPKHKVKFVTQGIQKIDERENVLLSKDEKIQITQFYKPNQSIKPIFVAADPKHELRDYYQIKECQDILATYLKNNNLFIKGTSEILVNNDLAKCLYRKTEERPAKCEMSEILQRFKSNLKSKDIITKTTGEEVSEICKVNQGGGSLKVKISTRKMNNKNVTIVEGLENFVNVKDAMKTFSKNFACSVTLKDFQTTKDAIFIQGYWVNELQEILLNELKLNKNFIQVDDKINLKHKKK